MVKEARVRSLATFVAAVACLFAGLALLAVRNPFSVFLIAVAVAAMFTTAYSAVRGRSPELKGKP